MPHERTSSSDDRRIRLGFAEAVAQHIGPLLSAKGFICTSQTSHAVHFQSASVLLDVLHDATSYEVDVSFALREAPTELFGLHDMLDYVLGSARTMHNLFQASQHQSVFASIEVITELMHRYGGDVLAGDPAVYQRIGECRKRHAEILTKQVVQRPAREAAEAAWRKHDFAKVRDLYEPIKDDLTTLERRRLAYARSRSLGTRLGGV